MAKWLLDNNASLGRFLVCAAKPNLVEEGRYRLKDGWRGCQIIDLVTLGWALFFQLSNSGCKFLETIKFVIIAGLIKEPLGKPAPNMFIKPSWAILLNTFAR